MSSTMAWESTRRGGRRRARRQRPWAPVVLALAAAVGQSALVVRAWESCATVADPLSGFDPRLVVGTGVLLLTGLNWLLIALPVQVWLRSQRPDRERWFLTVVASVVLVGAVTLGLARFVAFPHAGSGGGSCPSGVASWWPHQLPLA